MDFALTLSWTIPDHPSALVVRRYEFADATRHWIPPGFVIAPGHTVASDQIAYGGVTSTRAVSPFAGWMVGYQRFLYLPGTLLGLVVPVMIADYSRRYTLIAVPVACLAAGLSFIPHRIGIPATRTRATMTTPATPAISTSVTSTRLTNG